MTGVYLWLLVADTKYYVAKILQVYGRHWAPSHS